MEEKEKKSQIMILILMLLGAFCLLIFHLFTYISSSVVAHSTFLPPTLSSSKTIRSKGEAEEEKKNKWK